MSTSIVAPSGVILRDPQPLVVSAIRADSGEAFSIEAAGQGQLTGISYTIPAFSSGKVTAQLQMMAMTSVDVQNLNDLAMSMLDASYQEQVKQQAKTSATGQLSIWSWMFGGGQASASFDYTYESMKSKGLTTDQITTLMDSFAALAQNMSKVQIDLFVNNQNNDYPVSGDLYLYVVVGQVKTAKDTYTYRMLNNQASAGGPPPSGGGAPSSANVIALT